MIDYENIRIKICKGLREYLGCPVIRSNQNAPVEDAFRETQEEQQENVKTYPYVSYTITRLMDENAGTYGVYSDGMERKPFTQTWSISVLSNDDSECVMLALKAREWFDRAGNTYFSDNDIVIQSVGSVTNRDNFLTAEYEYRKGFDITVYLFDEIGDQTEADGYIETANINSNVEN